ncbi:MAG: hypothetical protein ACI8P3_001936 [Saprospiraceae bacterium]
MKIKNLFYFSIFLLICLLAITCPSVEKEGCCTCDAAQEQKKAAIPKGAFNFLVTGDPQYNYEEMNPDGVTASNSDKIGAIFAQKICCEQYEGAIIAGDLTHYSREDEFERYQNFISCFKPYAFDGLGNHDYAWIEKEPEDISAFVEYGLGEIITLERVRWEAKCLTIWNEVRDRTRTPQTNGSYPNIHYSWDWGNVHFIQLNLSAAENPTKFKPAQNPFKALSFLKEDLAKQVGDSGRPVILAHHYGFDGFSIGRNSDGIIIPKGEWWTGDDRQKYWETIAPYNVIAIFTGHAHYCDECYLPWDGQSIGEDLVGPDFIPTFVSGAAREGKYLDCQLTNDSLIVHRISHGQELFRKAFAVDRAQPTLTRWFYKISNLF